MGKVSDKILHDAEKEVERTLLEAKKKAEKIISDANKRKENILKDALIRKEKIINEEKDKKKIFEELNNNKEILRKKNEIIEEVLKKIKEKMLSFDEARYIDFIIKNLLSSISNDKDEIILGKMHSKKLRKAIDKIAKNKGLKFTVLQDDGNFDFGFVLNRKRIQIRFTIEDIIEELKENRGANIVEEIFG